jgi:hypothetical protein
VDATVGGAPRTISWHVINVFVTVIVTGPEVELTDECEISPPEHPQAPPPLLTTQVAGDVADHPFSDVPPWVEDAVVWAFQNELAEGYPDLTFRPTLNMTRAQVARLLYRINGSPDVSGLDPLGFGDVPPWVEDAVRWMAHFDYITGYPDDTFRPDLPITRAAVARMMYRTNGSPGGSPANSFSDVPGWVEAAVNWLADPANVPPYVTGYEDDTFRPYEDITRAETTRMACRVHTPSGTC